MERNLRNIILCFASLFVIVTIAKAFYFSQKNGGVDLRIRVVGARRLPTGQSPYFAKWNPRDGEYLLDPNDHAGRKVNGNVVTPATLLVIYPISTFSYPVVRLLWTIIEFMLIAMILLLTISRSPQSRWWPWCLILGGFVASDITLLHIDRGQIYLLYALLLAIIYRLYVSNYRYGTFVSGMLAGLLVFIRPFAILLLPVMSLGGRRQWIAGSLGGLLLGFLVFVLPQPSVWQDYLAAMQEYAFEYTGDSVFDPSQADPPMPNLIEGSNNLGKAQEFNISGLNPVPDYLRKFGIRLNQPQSFLLFGVVAGILFIIAFMRRRALSVSPVSLFLLGFLLYILAELFVLVPRGRYNLIQWLVPLCLLLPTLQQMKREFALLVLALLLFHNFPFVIPFQALVAELLLMLLLLRVVALESRRVIRMDAAGSVP